MIYLKQTKSQLQRGNFDLALKLLVAQESNILHWDADDFHVGGCTYLKNKNYKKGLKLLINALRKNPGNLQVLSDYATCLNGLSKYSWAEKTFLKCASSGFQRYTKALASFYHQRGEYRKSVNIYASINIHTLSCTELFHFADSLHNLRLNYKALRILRLSSSNREERITKLYFLILRKTGHFNSALNIIENCFNKGNGETILWLVFEKAKILAGLHRYSCAATFLETVSEQNENILSLTYEAGAQYLAAEMFQDALRCLKQAVKIAPTDVNCHMALGNCYSELYEYESASKHYSTAIDLDSKNSLAKYNLGAMYHKQQEYDKAIELYNQALKLDPLHTGSLRNLSSIYLLKNEEEKASGLLHTLLDLSKDDVTSFRHLVLVERGNVPNYIADYFMRRVIDHDVSDGDKAHIYFALFDLFNLKKDYATAYKYLDSGNFYRRRELNYSQHTEIKVLADVKKFFSSLPPFNVRVSDSPPQPIFVVGMPRSGTSLIEQFLRQSSNITAKGELEFLSFTIKNHINRVDLPLNVRVQKIRNEYLSLATGGVATKYFTDKMPLNFRWIGFIRLSFPNAKIVHVQRSSLPTLWSNYKVYFSRSGNGYIYNWDDLNEYFHGYRDLMQFWNERFPDSIITVSYEDLVSNEFDTIETLYNSLGLKFSSEVMEYRSKLGVVNTASFSQIKKGIYSGSNDDWKYYQDFIPPHIKNLFGDCA